MNQLAVLQNRESGMAILHKIKNYVVSFSWYKCSYIAMSFNLKKL